LLKIDLILSTYKRIENLTTTLNSLKNQIEINFNIHIVHNDPNTLGLVTDIVNSFVYDNESKNINLHPRNNRYVFFERHLLARDLAKSGTDIILFLDDDVAIPDTYVKSAVDSWEPESYKSQHSYSFYTNPPSYWERVKHTRPTESNYEIGYCGAGMSVVDSSIFLNDSFFSKKVLNKYKMFDDIWLSVFASNLGWKLNYFDGGATLSDDEKQTWISIKQLKKNFLDQLFYDGFKIYTTTK
jgi:glycosyltransferase involved in cell wall biosynthesis